MYQNNFTLLMNDIKKSLKDNSRLNYFKKELIKVLEAQEKDDDVISKAIEANDALMQKSLLNEFGIEKARGYGIGTIREWRGKKYRKIAPGKWRRIYDREDRGAKQSIKYIKSKIQNAKDLKELGEIVSQNIRRFYDSENKLLPIAQELLNEAKGKQSTINQEEAKKNEPRFVPKAISMEDIGNVSQKIQLKNFKVGDYIAFYSMSEQYRIKKITKLTDFGNGKFSVVTDGGHTDFLKEDDYYPRIKDSAHFEKSEADKLSDKFEEIKKIDDIDKRYLAEKELSNDLKNIMDDFREKRDSAKDEDEERKIMNEAELYADLQNDVDRALEKDYWNLPDVKKKQTELTERVKHDLNEFTERMKDLTQIENLDQRHKERNTLIKDLDSYHKQLASEYINVSYSDPKREIYRETLHAVERVIQNLKDTQKQEAKDRPSVQAQLDKLYSHKTYSAEEVTKAQNEADLIGKEFTDKVSKMRALNEEANKLNKQVVFRFREATEEEKKADDEKKAKVKELRSQADSIKKELQPLSDRLDDLMDVIADKAVNAEFDTTDIDECRTTEDIEAILINKGWFNSRYYALPRYFKFDNMDMGVAKNLAKACAQYFAIFPGAKGKIDGISYVRMRNDKTYAQVDTSGGGVTINSRYGDDEEKFINQYKGDVTNGYHPSGTDYSAVFIHELYHSFTRVVNYESVDVAKRVKAKVMQNYKIKGLKEKDLIKTYISKYGTADADEFGAEAFAQFVRGDKKTNMGRDVFKLMLKTLNYQGGYWL